MKTLEKYSEHWLRQANSVCRHIGSCAKTCLSIGACHNFWNLVGLCSHPLAPRPNFFSLLAKLRPLHFCIPTAATPTTVFPQLFGANPSWELFGQQVFRLSNKQNIRPNDTWFFKWVGISADFALLKAFFSIHSPTAGAVYECLVAKAENFRMTHLLRVLFELRHSLSPKNSTSFDEVQFLRAAVWIGSRSGDNLEIINSCLSNKPPLPTKKQYQPDPADCSVLTAASNLDIPILRVLVDAGVKVESQLHVRAGIGFILNHIYNWDPQEQDGLSDYIGLLLRGGVLEGSSEPQCVDDNRPKLITERCIMTWDELLIVCPPIMRTALQTALTPFPGHQGAHISKAGVFMAAQDGAIRLQAYLEAHQEDDPFLVHVILEKCLLFTAILNDFKTATALLEVGVDPHTGLLAKSLTGLQEGKLLWNPSTVAAAAGNLEVLTLLLGHTNLSFFLDFAPIHQLVHNEWLCRRREHDSDSMESTLCRLRNLRRYYLDAQARSSRRVFDGNIDVSMNTLNESGRNFETLEYIRSISHSQDLGQKVDLEIIKAAVFHRSRSWSPTHPQRIPCDVLLMNGLVDGHLEYEEEGMDLLHLSIRNHCSFPVVSLLLANGFKVHSSRSGQDRTSMLHDALLSESPDRSKIVELLLENGADCKVCGEGLSVLEASLWNGEDATDIMRLEYQRIFERLLNSGAPVHHWPRKCLKSWRPLVCLLLVVEASDDLILRVVDAGAPLNACGYSRWGGYTPLQSALVHEREGLARQLILRGADVYAPSSPQFGCTALQAACHYNAPTHFVEYLVDVLGVNVNEPPAKVEGLTSLAGAVTSGSLNTAEFLLNHGADVNAMCRFFLAIIPDNDNPWIRPLDLAVYNGNLDMVELLLKAGGRSGDAGLGGAICIAAEQGHYAVLSVLRSWDDKYRRRILEEEAIWQRQNPE